MEKTLFGIENFDVYMIMGILVAFGLLEVMSGQLSKSKRTSGDWIQEVGSFFVLSVVIKPMIVFAVYILGAYVLVEYQYVLSNWSMWLMLPLFYLLMIFYNMAITGQPMSMNFFGNYTDLIIKRRKWAFLCLTAMPLYIIC